MLKKCDNTSKKSHDHSPKSQAIFRQIFLTPLAEKMLHHHLKNRTSVPIKFDSFLRMVKNICEGAGV